MTLKKILDEMERHKAIFEDKNNFIDFHYEYACRTAEFEGIHPRRSPTYVWVVMECRLNAVLAMVKILYEQHPELQYFKIPTIKLEEVDKLVRKEHGGGKPLIP